MKSRILIDEKASGLGDPVGGVGWIVEGNRNGGVLLDDRERFDAGRSVVNFRRNMQWVRRRQNKAVGYYDRTIDL